jgi:hypothetical protein
MHPTSLMWPAVFLIRDPKYKGPRITRETWGHIFSQGGNKLGASSFLARNELNDIDIKFVDTKKHCLPRIHRLTLILLQIWEMLEIFYILLQ